MITNPKENRKNVHFVSAPPTEKIKDRALVFGTFDIIHPAHLRFLIEARLATKCKDCDLVVVLARDSSIERIKGRKPIFHETQRLRLISGLRIVDFARLGNEGENPFQVILEVEPDYIVLGYDQLIDEKPLQDFIKKHNLKISICRLPKYESGDLSSSSDVRERVLENWFVEKNNAAKE
ncbi:MAG TPA: adenylyltransferase/cytidyltransferase family protein [Candidatus Bathyarchaeia archaeon]|nr:adenylyltransferase/cytidyltransferase family protein [Candidatus Bathyarchaeia archaeon]